VLRFDRRSGARSWSATVPGAAQGLAIASPLIYVGLPGGLFCALSERDGTERWCFPLRVPLAGAPAVDRDADLVRVTLLDNTLRVLDRMNGAMRQQVSLGHRPATGPWMTGPSVVVALTTGEWVVIGRSTARVSARLSPAGRAGATALERAGISLDAGTLADVTIAPGGQRRLSVFRRRPAGGLPITTTTPVGPSVPLPLEGPSQSRPQAPFIPQPPPPVPRPFPMPR
jgi:hypothetical protein